MVKPVSAQLLMGARTELTHAFRLLQNEPSTVNGGWETAVSIVVSMGIIP